ncbi:ice-binding family protein [Psychroflexus salinarum]|uniref:Ice-binding family protein n=1 Tax=Psychroflexus salinarum TaxID=546024 RepID=A0ABW3GSM2_9FLAO
MNKINLKSSGEYVVLAKTAINNCPASEISGNMGISPAATTFITGFHKWTNTIIVPTDLVISGHSSEVRIFEIEDDLTVSTDVNITLSGSEKAENIFWQVAREVNFGARSNFKGIRWLKLTYKQMQHLPGVL